jgi:hypothetical protein
MNFKKIISTILAIYIFAGCASTTIVTSTNKDTTIYIDGKLMGKGSVNHTDTKTYGSTTVVKMSKTGCEDQTYYFKRNEEFDTGAFIGGFFLLVPFLWIMKYKPIHTYEFECVKTY